MIKTTHRQALQNQVDCMMFEILPQEFIEGRECAHYAVRDYHVDVQLHVPGPCI